MKMGLQHVSENLILLSRRKIKFFGIRKCPFNRRIQSRDEVNLLNTLRDSDMTSEEFINSLVDYRMQTVSAQRELSTTDYEAVSDDGIVKSLRDSYPEITDEEIADDYLKQRSIELRYYRSDETAVHDATSGRQLLQARRKQ
jgi:hypothetical protein